MSLDLISHKLTTSTTDENGVIYWENPIVSVKINSNGEVYCNGCSIQQNLSKSYTIKLNIDGKWTGWCASFNSLFCRVVLGKSLVDYVLKKVDLEKPYTEDNVIVLERHSKKVFPTAKEHKTEIPLNIDGKEMEQFYTVYEAKNEHITEDGAVFPTRELAEWHQTNVSKGKGNAQVVLDYNGGYVLAEQIYFQEVVYNKAKPYLHFTDVLNNNKGVVSNVQEEHCKFDKLDNEHGFRSEICFMTLRKQLPEQVSKHQAQKIQGALERYSGGVKALDESIVGLEALLKQVK